MSSQTSGTQYACVVYDAATGEIHHVHHVGVMDGAEAPTTQEIEARAMALAKQLGQHDPSGLKVLRVAPESLKPHVKHKVDLKNLTLISQ